ncbi:MAG: MATE family efflux transporter [Armatimonadota bacterium]
METHDDARVPAPLRIPVPPLSRRAWRAWWQGESGYREVLHLAWPLFLSYGSSTILQFTDRMFLTWYSPEAMAATAPAGMLAFTVQALFIGLVGYAATFVAQYTGAGRPRQAVAAVWQALFLAVLAALLLLPLALAGGAVFRLAGHPPAMQGMERDYFRIFILGAFPFIAAAAVSGYFIGKGKTQVLLWVNLAGALVNVVLDYLLIFGAWGFPQLGVSGAALASVLAQCVTLAAGFVIFLRDTRCVAGAWRPELALMRRLLRFGAPSGVQFMLDIMGWTFFLLLIGRLGTAELGATNLGFQVNSFAFFPVLGIAMAASTLVGQHLGRNRADLADRAVWSSIHLGLLFTLVMGVLFVTIPHLLIAPFGARANPVEFAPVREMTIVILRFVAAYCLFDVGNLVLASALKGAGDTLFVMLLSTSCSVALMLIPVLLFCIHPGGLGIYGAWFFLTLMVCVLSATFLLRYLRGHWRDMRVIEHEVIP